MIGMFPTSREYSPQALKVTINHADKLRATNFSATLDTPVWVIMMVKAVIVIATASVSINTA